MITDRFGLIGVINKTTDQYTKLRKNPIPSFERINLATLNRILPRLDFTTLIPRPNSLLYWTKKYAISTRVIYPSLISKLNNHVIYKWLLKIHILWRHPTSFYSPSQDGSFRRNPSVNTTLCRNSERTSLDSTICIRLQDTLKKKGKRKIFFTSLMGDRQRYRWQDVLPKKKNGGEGGTNLSLYLIMLKFYRVIRLYRKDSPLFFSVSTSLISFTDPSFNRQSHSDLISDTN